MAIWKWLNPKRLTDYPRLILIASWAVLILNLIFHHGWIGGLTGIMIGGDFISNYSGGVSYQTDINNLYNPEVQQQTQTQLIAPSQSAGFAPFISPPYVALTMSWITSIPLFYAFLIWEVINLICVGVSTFLITKYLLPEYLPKNKLPTYQLLIIVISSFAFVDGFLAGQSHGIILLVCTGILVAMLKEKWFLAGILGSVLTYKPQFVVGFLICWLVWWRLRALISFGILTVLWQIPIIGSHGLTPYLNYLQFTRSLLYLPYAKEGFPVSVMATPYALLATLLPLNFARALQVLFVIVDFVMIVVLAYMAYKSRKHPVHKRYFTFSLALLLPLVIAPHTLIYDLLILVPGLVILTNIKEITPTIKLFSVIFYACLLFFPLIGYVIKLALPGLIPVVLLFIMMKAYFRPKMAAELS